jgi:hypothetical protein
VRSRLVGLKGAALSAKADAESTEANGVSDARSKSPEREVGFADLL